MPDAMLEEFVDKLNSLCKKYEITFEQVEDEIRETELALSKLLDDLTGNEFDMKAIFELKKLLGGK